MSKIYLSHHAGRELQEYLRGQGHTLILLEDDPRYGRGMESHADLRMCKTGAEPDSPLLFGDPPSRPDYPENAAFCAVFLDRYLIHRLDITAKNVLQSAKKQGLIPVNVRQGYTRCSAAVVDGRSLITADPGIRAALDPLPDVDVLRIAPGHVCLPGFDTGFIGGTCGRVGDEVVFNGDLTAHPDHERIRAFIEARGLRVRFFPEYELTDIGSIIESNKE